jgi:hypothetical protein
MTPLFRRCRPEWPGYMLAVALACWPSIAVSAEIKECRVGFAGVYKVGHWTPVWVDLVIDNPGSSHAIDVTANDSDGVPAMFWHAVPEKDSPGKRGTTTLAVQVGRMNSALAVVLRNNDAEIDRVDMRPGQALRDLPATGELLVAVGTEKFGWNEAFPNREGSGEQIARRAVQLNRVDELPTTWFGYDGVDVLVLSVGDGALCKKLASDAVRLAALRQWVELGGRLVILCGGDAVKDLFAEGRPLAAFLPGKFAGMARLPQMDRLEHFSESAAQIAGQGVRVELSVPKLTDVSGMIEAYAGQQPTDLPLVVRGPMGLGEVAVAGVDLSAPPLAGWAGRTAFLHVLLRPYLAKNESSDAPQMLMSLGYNDLSGALRQRLASAFANVRTMTFPVVATLAIAYLLILGPGDYWLVHKVLRRPRAAWITFPLLVLATSACAYALAGWSKGAGGARVNQVQLVDFDLSGGRTRGTYWAALYSPDARRFDFGLSSDPSSSGGDTLLACWGLTGSGIGGMDARNVDLGITRTGYRVAPSLDALEGVPLLTASSKSLIGRWTAPVKPLVEAELIEEDELPAGTITNRTGGPLKNARLLYGTWAYRLGNLEDGQQFEVGPHLDAIQVRTMVARSAGIAADQLSGETERSMFFSDRASAEELVNLIMFYEAAGGQAFAQLPSRYQSYCDLSRLLQFGRAILVAEAPGPGRQLVDGDGKRLGKSDGTSLVMYRFVLPVDKK